MDSLRVLLLTGDREFTSAFGALCVTPLVARWRVHDDEQAASGGAARIFRLKSFRRMRRLRSPMAVSCAVTLARKAPADHGACVAVTLDNSSETLAACRAGSAPISLLEAAGQRAAASDFLPSRNRSDVMRSTTDSGSSTNADCED